MITGRQQTGSIRHNQGGIDWLVEKVEKLGGGEPQAPPDQVTTGYERRVPQRAKPNLTDDQIIERASRATNGRKFRALYGGDTAGYKSASEADLALAGLLAFWSQDEGQIERIITSSGLLRPKWSGRADYRRRTVRRALSDIGEVYSELGLQPHYLSLNNAYNGHTMESQFQPESELKDATPLADRADAKHGYQDGGPHSDRTSAPETPENTLLSELRRQLDIMMLENAVLRNPYLKQAGPTLVDLAKELAALTARGDVDPDGYCWVKMWRFALRAGASQATVSRHLKFAVVQGIYQRRVRQVDVVNPSTGEILPCTVVSRTSYKVEGDLVSDLVRLATWQGTSNWGGKRHYQCPEHPDAKVEHKHTCAECGRELKPLRERGGRQSRKARA